MGFGEIFSTIFKPLTELVDELHTSKEEKMQIQAAVAGVLYSTLGKVLEYERAIFEAQRDVITAEAKGESWLQRSWRPITMLTFLVLIVANQFGITPVPLADNMWKLMEFGLGGYVIGRSAEKVLPEIVKAIKPQ